MKKIQLFRCGIALSVILTTSGAFADNGEHGWNPAQHSRTIIGAWEVEVTVRFDAPECTTSPPVPFGPNPFPSLNTFHLGGTMSETGSRSPPSARSPGHGVWERTGHRTYDARYTFQGFDANGFLATNMDVRSAIKLSADGNTFTGVSRLLFGDISGNATPFCATLNGVRFSL